MLLSTIIFKYFPCPFGKKKLGQFHAELSGMIQGPGQLALERLAGWPSDESRKNQTGTIDFG